MSKNIKKFLDSSDLKNDPIIKRWMKSPRMQEALAIFDKQVEYLLNLGAKHKLEQWFLSGDSNFNDITAERYIISYLRQKNENIFDNLNTAGIDAYINCGNSSVGIEITTLNGFFAEWIIIERLTQLLDENRFLSDKGLEITCSHQKIRDLTQGGTIREYIKQAGNAIISNNKQEIDRLNLKVERHDRTGKISWDFDNGDSFPWFKYITHDLTQKLQASSKAQQLKSFESNIVFVGVNHLSVGNWAFPCIFDEIGNSSISYSSEIEEIRNYWMSHMSTLNNVIGICYFLYSLDRECPFYPLKIFWRSDADTIAINL